MMFDIEENLKKLPDSPGVYMHKDKLGQIIYVGKAVSLKSRVRQYFRASGKTDMKVRAMTSHIAEFEYITCGTEMEALILECNLIKKYTPKYNVILRDDKTYPFIKVTVHEEYPRVLKTRRIERDNAKYFGPYSDVPAVNLSVDLLSEVYKLKSCPAKKFPPGFRPCLNYHIGRCRGVCAGNVDRDEYRRDVGHVLEFLNGKNKGILEYLKNEMSRAAEEMNFENAAKFRDHIESVKSLSEKQRVVLLGAKDADIVLALASEKSRYIILFFVRDGKLSGRESHPLQAGKDDGPADLVSAFVKQYYMESAVIPKEIYVSEELPESALISEYLSKLAGHAVSIIRPQKGDKKALLEMAEKDVAEMAKIIDEKARLQSERKYELGMEIYRILNPGKDDYPGFEYRIESYDISNTNGVDTVGGMVVFEGTAPKRKDYRRFKVRSAAASDDYGSLKEVVYRRFKRAQEGDPGFSHIPDLLLVDGGKNQVSAVEKVLESMKIIIPVLGMVKDEHHKTRGLICRGGEIELKDNHLLFKYIGTIQEETHRFAIEYHRGVRDRKMRTSVLDNIEGVGVKRRNALLACFGSIDNIKNAELDDLCKVKGITKSVAANIKDYFN